MEWQGKSIEHMKKGRCKKAPKAKTPAEILLVISN